MKELVTVAGKEGKVIKSGEDFASYKFVLCASCFYEGSYPLILGSSDFVKRSVLEVMPEEEGQESEKKKSN